MMRFLGWLGAALMMVLLAPATADPPEAVETPSEAGEFLPPPSECRLVDFEMAPVAGLQIVAWIEDASGAFVDTIYITQATGRYGIGNRPGVFGMRSGPNWPYGPREDVFPVWSHRHGMTWNKVRFQNGDGDPGGAIDCTEGSCKNDPDRNLSHPFDQSSIETHFARPLRPDESAWDVGSGPSAAFTDKGTMRPSASSEQLYSLYPPRDDVTRNAMTDDEDVATYDEQNPFDAVSQATPLGGQPYRYSWLIPPELYTSVAVDYTMYVEVNKEFDDNPSYNPNTLPTATASGWNEYGKPYRGQPSVVYKVPFQIGPDASRQLTAEYVGYGDPAMADGAIRPPDATITTDSVGKGALRLAIVHDQITGEDYQVRVEARFETDTVAPGSTGVVDVLDVTGSSAQLELTAPGDDGMIGRAAGFDVRYRVGEPITYANFGSSPRVIPTPDPDEPGTRQAVTVRGLLPSTTYYVAARAYDSCRNYGPISVAELTTDDRTSGEVDACFVATAAYGSVMANDVVMLRRFRDTILRSTVLGELAVETYYTFGPAIAAVVGESELLRETARAALGPVVDQVRSMSVPASPH
jgi:hypothetical protein